MSGEHDEPMNRQGPIRIPPPPPPRSRPSAASIRPNQMWGSPVVNTLSLPSHFASENVNRIEGTSELPAGMTTPTRSLQRPNFSSPLEETPPYRYPSAESVLSQHVIGNQDSPMQSAYALGPRQPALAASSPAKYIASALRFSPTGDQPRATGLMLTTSNFGGRHNTLQQVYLERTAALNEAFEQHGHRWGESNYTQTLPNTVIGGRSSQSTHLRTPYRLH